MKKMAKILAAALACVFVFSACAGDTGADGGGNDTAAAGDFNTNRPIAVISREEGSGTRGAFIEILGIQVTDDAGNVRDHTTIDAVIANGTNPVMQNVAGNDYAVGYISLGALSDSVRALDINGVAATPENVMNGTYPLFRAFNIALRDELEPLAQDFVNFILSAEGQAVAEERGYITVDPNAPAYQSAGLTGTVSVSGSTSVAPLMTRLEEAFEALNPGTNVEVHITGSSAGITAAINGTADIGMVSRELRESELAEVSSVPIAYDGLAVIVNNNNPIAGMTQEEVRQVFVGEFLRWNELF